MKPMPALSDPSRLARVTLACFWSALVAALFTAGPLYAQRIFGLDTSSAANHNAPSQAAWNNAFSDADGDGVAYKFAIVRSSRGGTVDQRLDDAHFYQNITRATAAGMLAGSYHYARPDSPAHTAADDAAHYLEQAGMYMKPGYLLPVFDLEAGNVAHSTPSLTAWGLEFMETIYDSKGVYPIVYTNSSYNNDEVNAQLAFTNFGSTPKTGPRTYQWLARPSGNLRTGEPIAANNYPNPYGVWDPNFVTRTNSRDPAINPWVFWQNGSGSPNGFLIDYNAANGNIEFVKDFLVPALWTTSGDGNWNTIANWNSDNPSYNGTIQSGPAPRLPNNGSLDWVKLQNPSGGTVTISGGRQTVRKFTTEQPLNISGGSLNVTYVPGSGGMFDLPSEFSAPVTLSSRGAYSARVTQVNGDGGSFNLNGGNVTFSEILLASHATTPGKIVLSGNATFTPTSGGSTTAVIRSTGNATQQGAVELTSGSRWLSVTNGAANVDLDIRAPVTGAGRLVKGGPGTLLLSSANSYSGGTTVSGGVLQVTNDSQLGTPPVNPQEGNIILDGGTLRTGARIESASLTSSGSGYTSFPSLSIGGAGTSAHTASANVLAGITSIAITNGGTGYVNQNPASPPAANTAGTFVDIVGGGGTGATAYATVVGGKVTSVTITNPGTGYTSMPTIHISSTATGGVAGSGVSAHVSGIALQGITLDDGGFDYTSPTLTLTGGGGTGATASATSSPAINFSPHRGFQLTASGGILEQTAGTTTTIAGVVSSTGDGALTKSGGGTLVLKGANTYSGDTHITGGLLRLSGEGARLGTGDVTVEGNARMRIESGVADGLSDEATLSLFGGGMPDLADSGFAFLGSGVTEVVGSLLLGGVIQVNGTYGATGSGAEYIFDEYFGGTGLLQVGTTPPLFAGDYNDDGVVDAADYVVWRNALGQPAGTLPNDNTNTAIGEEQYLVWKSNYGNVATGSATMSAIPEPSTVALAVVMLGAVMARRIGRRSAGLFRIGGI